MPIVFNYVEMDQNMNGKKAVAILQAVVSNQVSRLMNGTFQEVGYILVGRTCRSTEC